MILKLVTIAMHIYKCTDLSYIGTLREVLEYVNSLTHKWFHLGLSLRLSYATLKGIGHDIQRDHMTVMIQKWLGVTGERKPTWRYLALALHCPLVKEKDVAYQIE